MWLKIFLTTWKLINIRLGNPQIKANIKTEIKNSLETDEKGNILFQNLWDRSGGLGPYTALPPNPCSGVPGELPPELLRVAAFQGGSALGNALGLGWMQMLRLLVG